MLSLLSFLSMQSMHTFSPAWCKFSTNNIIVAKIERQFKIT